VLRTGGKAASHRQAVFGLAVTAQNMTNCGTPSPTNVPVPYNKITVMGQPLGNDNNLFVVEPDGISLPVPVDVPGSPSFTFNVTPTKHHFALFANGYLLAPDKVSPTAHFCVGQHVTFDQAFIPPLPSGTKLTPIQWLLDGTFVNQYIPPDASRSTFATIYNVNASGYYTKAPDMLKSPSTSAWWIDGAYTSPTNRAALGEGITFHNGQYLSIATHGQFTMHKPTVAWDALSYVPGVVQGHTSYEWLSVGIGDFWNAPNQITFYQMAALCTTRFQGQFGLTQLIIGQSDLESWSSWRLDNTAPYSYETNNLPFHDRWLISYVFSDNPSCFCVRGAFCADEFKQYFVFTPGTPNSIWISLGLAYWGWNGTVVYDPTTPFNVTKGWNWNWVGSPLFWSSQSITPSTEQPFWESTKVNY
jgi:hypothetical protein